MCVQNDTMFMLKNSNFYLFTYIFLGYPHTLINPAIEPVEVEGPNADPELLTCAFEEDEVELRAEKPIIKRKMASPLVTGSKKMAVTPAMLRKNLSSMTKRKVQYFDESVEVMKRKEAWDAELHQLHVRKAVADCMAAEALQRSAEAQQELSELLLKKEKEKHNHS